MSGEKMGAKSEGVRVTQADIEWLDSWVAETGQDRSKPIRAGLRLLRMVVETLPFEAKVKFVARFSANEQNREDERASVLAALVAKAIVEAEAPPGPPLPPAALDRKRGQGKR